MVLTVVHTYLLERSEGEDQADSIRPDSVSQISEDAMSTRQNSRADNFARNVLHGSTLSRPASAGKETFGQITLCPD